VAPPFDATQGFGYDKPAHLPCVNLRADFRCAIYERLPEHGFSACPTFDCHGAGQYVTQVVFQGAHWRDAPERAAAMFALYPRMRALHEALALLTVARTHFGDPATRAEVDARLARIDALRAVLAQDRSSVDAGAILRETLRWLRAQRVSEGALRRASE
jgi:hypothetical protein